MKIRIKGNSVRLRLTRSEVDMLATGAAIEERTAFGDGVFSYSLQSKEGIDNLDASFSGSAITIYMPANIPAAWAKNETVGYNHTLQYDNGNSLYILVEKDFKCIDAAITEDQSDNFENPLTSC